MEHKQPELPYAMDALAPAISRETLEYHYGKHHAGYFKKLNEALESAPAAYAKLNLEELVCKVEPQHTGILNNAAQAWNHSFYWDCMTPQPSAEPTGEFLQAIDSAFGSFAALKKSFGDAAKGQFGSGWAWIVCNADGELAVTATSNEGNPLRDGCTPLFVCDVWEHAYYIDYRNDRPAYVDAFFKLANWDFAAEQFAAARAAQAAA
jgi:Fe-Mn family superoxide dismutase